ncbi:3-oxoacyl-[acyl-carrier-protein] reductase FabG [Stieleria neptunia]|uniref:3-oxoacyl-[acyl-carrier-protein] reductase FabG n=1 Tax=Stieleria neptunia TaxID=2527979 RepID=A0A518HN67_9BACT|nr:SDR family NAD(P)-dependent oxidoreductase [Stieleria neptunia]QDV42291.1 3-oxoacyl-[acyl-carrier-protein] reductase FabG [Stieleria neptunia]
MKTILVTGGTRGLGLATVRLLLENGNRVVATGRSLSPALEALIADHQPSNRLHFQRLDLSDLASIKDVIAGIVKRHGEIYGLVNNAALGHDGVLATMHESQIKELIEVNVTGTIMVTKYVSRSMLMQREGRIVNVASIIGHTGFNGLSVYAATKGALLAFTRSLARELGKANVMVNSVSPGFLETDMTASIGEEKLNTIRRRSPTKSLPSVQDVAAAIAFLIGESSGSMTGSDLIVDAGNTA